MSVKVNQAAFNNAKQLIKAGKVTFETEWSKAQPAPEEETRHIEVHGWEAYEKWYLGLDAAEAKQTKARYSFPIGDFKRIHRSGVIAAKQRAAQNEHNAVKKAADELLTLIDRYRKGMEREEN